MSEGSRVNIGIFVVVVVVVNSLVLSQGVGWGGVSSEGFRENIGLFVVVSSLVSRGRLESGVVGGLQREHWAICVHSLVLCQEEGWTYCQG